jgi:hypothetical protein
VFTEALKLYGSRLTQYERSEITEYPQVWYLGLDACKIHCEEGGAQNGGYDDDNGSYHKVGDNIQEYISKYIKQFFIIIIIKLYLPFNRSFYCIIISSSNVTQ